jgi:hypothetical protein
MFSNYEEERCVAQALLPVPGGRLGGDKHRQECRCHTIVTSSGRDVGFMP